MPVAHEMLRELSHEPADYRWLIQGTGIVGDIAYVGWLVDHLRDEKTARLAGESFSLITGVDLAPADLERARPENFESGPNDEAGRSRTSTWTQTTAFLGRTRRRSKSGGLPTRTASKKGTRYFMGKPVTREHCIDVLKNGYQRQRILAAHYLCLLDPGTPLFNTSAPAWRQQRLLAAM